MSGLESLKLQILTMAAMKGDSISSMIYSFLLVTVIEYIFSFIPFVKGIIETRANEYFRKVSSDISIATNIVLSEKPKEKTSSIFFSRKYDEGVNDGKNLNSYESADCLLEIMTQLDSCKHLVCDKFFYVNHHEIIEISSKIFMQIKKIEKHSKGGLLFIDFELFSYEYTLTELQEYINKIVKSSRIKRQNKLGNQLYYFNEIVEALPKQNGKIIYGRAPPFIGFSMTPFFTNKNLTNIYGENFQVVRKRVEFFMNNEDWYKKKGIPYTLGILIHGPPGSGKTSCIKAIANSTKRHIVNITLSENTTKTQLQNLFYNNELIINNTNSQEKLNIPCDKRIYVIEDIDCLSDVVLDRKIKEEQERKKEEEEKQKQRVKNASDPFGSKTLEQGQSSLNEDADEKLNLSFLLNLFDGVLETPGRILIMSSNYPERIDKALIRPGRVDLNMCFGYCSKETIKQIINFIYEIPLDEISNLDFADNVYTPAQVNQFLFNNIDNKQKGIESLLKCNYINLTPTITPREKVHTTTFVEEVDEPEISKELLTKEENESPRGTTSLDDTFFKEEVKISNELKKQIENIKHQLTNEEYNKILDELYKKEINKEISSNKREKIESGVDFSKEYEQKIEDMVNKSRKISTSHPNDINGEQQIMFENTIYNEPVQNAYKILEERNNRDISLYKHKLIDDL